jgi:hypothetical protein
VFCKDIEYKRTFFPVRTLRRSSFFFRSLSLRFLRFLSRLLSRTFSLCLDPSLLRSLDRERERERERDRCRLRFAVRLGSSKEASEEESTESEGDRERVRRLASWNACCICIGDQWVGPRNLVRRQTHNTRISFTLLAARRMLIISVLFLFQ